LPVYKAKAKASNSYIHRVRKKGATLFLPVTLRNANRFSKFFYRHTLQ